MKMNKRHNSNARVVVLGMHGVKDDNHLANSLCMVAKMPTKLKKLIWRLVKCEVASHSQVVLQHYVTDKLKKIIIFQMLLLELYSV